MYCGVSDPLRRANCFGSWEGWGLGGDIFCNLWATDNKPIVWPIPLLVTATSQSGKEQFGVMGRGEGRPSPASMGDRQCGCQLGRGQQSDKKLGNKSCRPSSITAPTFLGSSCSKALSISGKEKSLPRTQALIFTQNPKSNISSSSFRGRTSRIKNAVFFKPMGEGGHPKFKNCVANFV